MAGGFIDTNRFDGPVSNVQIPQSQFNQGYTDVQYQYRNFSVRGWWQGNDIPVDSAAHPLLSALCDKPTQRADPMCPSPRIPIT